MYFIIFSKITT